MIERGDTYHRNETEAERADRKWGDLLQELRVLQTGVQLLAAFLLTLPFQPGFDDLDELQEGMYLGLVVLAALTTAVVMTPVAIHRRTSGQHRKDRVVRAGHILATTGLVAVSALVVGITVFVFDIVAGRLSAGIVGASMALVVVALLVLLPRRIGARGR